MAFYEKILRAYFDLVYNPLYDFTTARLPRYKNLQARCITMLSFTPNQRVLCIGLGTGNELAAILNVCREVSIVGIDTSQAALDRARRRARALGKRVRLELMDARNLKFETESFDTVLCMHVMDFVTEVQTVTRELLRVLKTGGQFVATYPSLPDTGLGSKLIRDTIRENLRAGRSRLRAYLEAMARLATGPIYLPLLLRPNQQAFSHRDLDALMRRLGIDGHAIEEDRVFQDFIVHGRKPGGTGR